MLALLTLWLFARESRPDGCLDGMDVEDIELAVDWCGESGALIAALEEFRLLDKTRKGYQIHNWSRNNPWSAGAKRRSEQAKKAINSRWEKQRKNKGLDTVSITDLYCENESVIPSFKTLEPKTLEPNQKPKTLKPESTNLEQSTSSRRPCFSTEGSEEEKQPSPSPSSPKGDDEKKGDGFLAQVSRLHFRLFGYALKPLELKTLEGYPQASVLAKYEEALSRRGSRQEVKFFSWIEAGLKGGGEKPGLLKRLFGGADEDRARGYRVDVG